MAKNWKDASRTAWSTKGGNDTGSDITDQRLQIGCLQRIADATEAMAQHHVALIAERDEAVRVRDYWRAETERLKRTVRGLRGQITRMKRHASEGRADG